MQVPRGKGIYEDEGDSFDKRSSKSTGDADAEEADEPTA
jgi:hypothetical protein